MSSTTPEPASHSTVVVDTMIASAWLGVRASQRRARWAPLLERSAWVLPFTVVAEMRFGAEVARNSDSGPTPERPVRRPCRSTTTAASWITPDGHRRHL